MEELEKHISEVTGVRVSGLDFKNKHKSVWTVMLLDLLQNKKLYIRGILPNEEILLVFM